MWNRLCGRCAVPRLHAFRPRRIRGSIDAQVFPYFQARCLAFGVLPGFPTFREGAGEGRVCRVLLLGGEGPAPKRCPVRQPVRIAAT